jgi:hypothetical protein
MEHVNGKARGGVVRAERLTAARRKEISLKGVAVKRELASLPKATHGSSDHPLTIGNIEIPCFVLENSVRVLSQRGLQTGIGMSVGGGSKTGEQRLVRFLGSIAEKNKENNDLTARITGLSEKLQNPIKFRQSGGGGAVFGYEATILADLCDVILAARKAGLLLRQQNHIADQAELLVRGFARVGIIALVDEATGYQKDRARDALAKILEAFVAKELQPYVKKFPAEFYEGMFRLRGLRFDPTSVKRPRYFGLLTNDIVYRRLAPGVWRELKAKTKKNADGRSVHHLHRFLTPDVGDPRLRELITKVTTIMQLSDNWGDFKNKLDRIVPASTELPCELKDDTGKDL